MKKLIEGTELLNFVPQSYTTGRGPVVQLEHGLILDDGNCFESPTLILGGVGTGKSTLMKHILTSVLQETDKNGDNVVVFCAKPEFLSFSRENDIIVSPYHNNKASCCWNLFEEMKASKNPYQMLREISIELFAESEQKTTQIFFPQAASDLFYQSARYLYDYSIRKNIPVSNADLLEFITTTPVWGDDKVPGWMDLASLLPEYFGICADYIGKEEGNGQGMGVLSELRIMFYRYFFGSFAADKGEFSVIKTLKKRGQRIFLYYDYALASHSSLPIFHILIDLLLKQAMDIDNQQKTWFFLDEGSLLPKSDVLTDALSLGRDPGSNGTGGVRIIMAMQSARLMAHHYTQSEAEAQLSLFPNVISLRIADSTSRAVIADRYGKAHYQYSYAGVGGKELHTDSYEPVVSDFQYSQLTKKGQAIVSIPGISNSPFIYDGYFEKD